MEKDYSVSFVNMTIDEVVAKCMYFEENRSHFTNEEEAEAHFFSKSTTKKTVSRIKGYKNNIFKKDKVWKKCCAMVVYNVDGLLYIVDGQGRLEAVKEYNSEVEETERITTIPVLLYEGMTYEEMVKDVISLNKFQRNWDTEEMWRSERVGNGQEEKYIEEVKLVTAYENALEVPRYTARLIALGCGKASHRNSNFKGDVISPYHDIMREAFEIFYNIAVASCNGETKDISTIKNVDVAIAFESIIMQVIKVCEKQKVDFVSRAKKVSEILGNFIAQMDRVYGFEQNLKHKSKVAKKCFIKAINKKTQDRYVKIATYNINRTLNK